MNIRADILAIVDCLPNRPAVPTRRQAQVAWGIVQQQSDEAIAFDMGVTVHAVHAHVKAIKEATGTNSRQGITAWWVAAELLEVVGRQDGDSCDPETE